MLTVVSTAGASSPLVRGRLPWLPTVLMLAVVMPAILDVAGLRLTAGRIVLVAVFLPVVWSWLAGRAGRLRLADALVLCCTLWTMVALLAVEGPARFQYAAVVAIEMLCPYLIARCHIRSETDYAALIRFLWWIAVFLVPAAVVEALTTLRPYAMLLDPVFHVFPKADYEFRWGMSRAQVVFEHPILFGVYAATFCAPVYMLARIHCARPLQALAWVAPVVVATFFSLSTGGYLGLIVQVLLIGWGYLMRRSVHRWSILAALATLGYVVVDMLSSRTPFEVFISYLTFNSATSYARVLIFDLGIQNVWARPLFGVGLGDWDRPAWMVHASVDNFWLLMAMRYGILAFLFIALAFAAVLAVMMRARPASEPARLLRNGHVFSLIGLILSICTVHLWSATFVFMMFMLGAGLWVADAPQARALGPRGVGGVMPPAAPAGRRRATAAAAASKASDRTPPSAPPAPAARS